eukprot:gene14152-5153_t
MFKQIAYKKSNKFPAPVLMPHQPLAGVLLSVNFNHPFYSVIPLLKEYYEPVFEKIIFCGPEKSSEFNVVVIEGSRGHYGYMCIAEAIKKYPNYLGYLYVNDDMVVNWWTLVQKPRDRIWYGKDIINEAGANMDMPAPCCWHWWNDVGALENCRKAFDALNSTSSWKEKKHFEIYSNNTGGIRLCVRAWSDFMYIPQRLAQSYLTFSESFYRYQVFLEVAVSTILLMLDAKNKIVNLDGAYLPDIYGDIDFSDGNIFADNYDTKRSFYHPVKLSVEGRALSLFKNTIMRNSIQCVKNLARNATLIC